MIRCSFCFKPSFVYAELSCGKLACKDCATPEDIEGGVETLVRLKDVVSIRGVGDGVTEVMVNERQPARAAPSPDLIRKAGLL